MRRFGNPETRRAAAGLIAIGVALVAWSGALEAAVLTCDLFENRLREAVKAAPRPEPDAASATLVFATIRDKGASGRTLAWNGVAGLSGRLTCGAADAFADFYMLAPPGAWPGSATAPLAPGFSTLAAASICALSAASAQDCATAATTMTDDGLDQYREDLAHKDDHPQSLQDYDLGPDLDAVFYVTPSALSWAIGPGLFATLDAQRKPLDVQDRGAAADDDE